MAYRETVYHLAFRDIVLLYNQQFNGAHGVIMRDERIKSERADVKDDDHGVKKNDLAADETRTTAKLFLC